MDLEILRSYELLGLLVVVQLYGFPSLFAVAGPLKFRRLRLRENPDIIVELAVSLSKFSTKPPRKTACLVVQGDLCKIIDVVRRKLFFVRLYMGNPS
jgi:hypothetical protein